MEALAVLLREPERLDIKNLALMPPGPEDVVVDTAWSGISTGTEKLLWSGRMPDFPGMGYPLVPGYESVGRVAQAGRDSGRSEGEWVFVPGSNCFAGVRGLFGGASSKLVAPARRVIPVSESLGADGVLLALAATAHHAILPNTRPLPDLVIGHGVLGRLIARIAVALGGAPTVWETAPKRGSGGLGYPVRRPEEDPRHDYGVICDASGDAQNIDRLVARLKRGGEIVLAGFYADRPSFSFPPAFMREATFRVAAEWAPNDLEAVGRLVAEGLLSLEGLVTHRAAPDAVGDAYEQAFTDPRCLKMVLDWRLAA